MSLRLHYQRIGQGPALLILHGLFGSGTNWRSIARVLGEHHEVFLPDARNHGASPHTEDMSYALLAQDVRDFLDQHSLRQVDVIGHSMGGKTAMWLALNNPSRVHRLMVVDIAPAVSGNDHGPLIDIMQNLPVARMQRRAEAEEALAIHVREPGLRAFLTQNLITSNGHLAWRINLPVIARKLSMLRDFPQASADQKFNNSTLFLRGEHSDYVSETHHPTINALFPKAQIETLPNTGHWLHAEQPMRFAERARELFRTATTC